METRKFRWILEETDFPPPDTCSRQLEEGRRGLSVVVYQMAVTIPFHIYKNGICLLPRRATEGKKLTGLLSLALFK